MTKKTKDAEPRKQGRKLTIDRSTLKDLEPAKAEKDLARGGLSVIAKSKRNHSLPMTSTLSIT